ncbi:MAG: MBL fold metallo-hydrolase [Candidatus Pacebacteria bacterium]|nr:MBL fold metallo-hydrolase [Candidatus Paceibacterota bacterium]
MNNLKIKKFVVGPISTNIYVIYDEKTKKAFLVDCAAPINEYKDFILKNNLNLEFVVITHGHYDHIDGLNEFLTEFDVPFYVSEKDQHMLINPMNNGSLMMGDPMVINKKAKLLIDEQKIKFEDKELEIIETSGHTQGGVCVKLNDWLFSGDTLFYRSVGRTDFPYSNTEQLQDSIKNKLFKLDKNTQVFPGHGRETTIGEELIENPFI